MKLNKLNQIYNTRNQISKVQKPILLLLTLVAVIGIGILDYFLNSQYNIFLIYIFPIMFISWSRGKGAGIAISLIAIFVWFITELLTTFTLEILPILLINTALRLMTFSLIIYVLGILNHLYKELQKESRHDFLTGIPNLRMFYEYAQKEIDRSKRNAFSFTIAYIDLDNFKRVNDDYGHLEGNSLLKIIAQTIKSHIRSMDIIARVGGDEFVLLLPENSLKQAEIVIQKIKSELDRMMKLNNWPVTFSIGVISVGKAIESLDELIKLSDQLMYDVKQSGKNNIKFKSI